MNKYKDFSRAAQEANKRLRACERKKRFASEAAAFQKNTRVYKCPYCDGWHRTGAFQRFVKKLARKKSP